MSTLDVKFDRLKKGQPTGYWRERILSQLEYALTLSKVRDHQYDSIISSAISLLETKQSEESTITKQVALETEKIIECLSSDAKSFHMICAAHAHIDMNWMWRWDETVSVTIDTFRTMLDLMKEYPDFIFSQSQASVYRIIEEYAPEMLTEIRARIQEGRWEVTASSWVETDKNMPNGESLSRHILYTKKYLSQLFNLDPDSLNLDFEPDTFGHNANVPEILATGGVKYYYHCRGYDGHNLFKWESPSGNAVTVYREPLWYLGDINPSIAMYVPEFCTQNNMNTMLKVYGVGDHGGGPTRRDLERIIDMNKWPVFPAIRFGTFREFYTLVDQVADSLPIVKQELNFVFTGCYTTQTRIKMANRIGEATLQEAETFSAVSAINANFHYSSEAFAEAWKNLLFNQFHDIIPGSGVIDTREYAMGLFQKTMATANTHKNLSMREIADKIDTSAFKDEEENISETISEGAGVGFGIEEFKITQCERGRGRNRIFHIFNSSLHDRKEAVEITVWDWNGDIEHVICKDSLGLITPHQILVSDVNRYWGHTYLKLLLKVNVPGCGYSTYTISEDDNYESIKAFPQDPRVHKPVEYILENDYIKVTFDTIDASILSMIDKKTGTEMIDPYSPAGVFRFIQEDDREGMTAWIVGRYMNIENLIENVKIQKLNSVPGQLRQSIQIEIAFKSSTLKAVISLDYSSPVLRYDVVCDWHEIGKLGNGVPQLGFYVPLAYTCSNYKYDIPFGVIERPEMDMDLPGNSWVLGNNEKKEENSLMLVTSSKYGFRCIDDALSVTLIRSSYDPDPYPELGIHKFSIALCLTENKKNCDTIELAYQFNHPLNVLSAIAHPGTKELSQSLLSLKKGNITVSAVKQSEASNHNNTLILRVYETEGNNTEASIEFSKKPVKAYFVDLNERTIDGSTNILLGDDFISFTIAAHHTGSICIEF